MIKKKEVIFSIAAILLISLIIFIGIYDNNKMKDTSRICIGYGFNSYVGIIDKQQDIKILVDLFKKPKVDSISTEMKQSYIWILFENEKNTYEFHIDENDTLKLPNGKLIKSSDITFNQMLNMYKDIRKEEKP